MKLISLAPIVLFATLPAFSDSVPFTVFAVQPTGLVTLDPNTNPLLVQSTLCNCLLIDIVNPTPSITTVYTFDYTFAFGSQVFVGTPFMLTCLPTAPNGACAIGYQFPAPCCNTTAIPGTFTATVNGISETVHFEYKPIISSVPEPTTISLLATGLIGVSWRHRARRRNPKSGRI
jgi:hypothetical protein